MNALAIGAGVAALLAGCTAATTGDSEPPARAVNLAASMLATPALARSPAVIEPEAHRLQVLIAEVVQRDGKPALERHGIRVDAEYFYPASTIKLAAAVVACQELERIEADRLEHAHDSGVEAEPDPHRGLRAPMEFIPAFAGETAEAQDPTNLEGGTITVGHEIRKLFIVSSNTAYNRLYDLAGQEPLNHAMWAAGLESTRLSHRLSIARTIEQNRITRAVTLATASGTVEVPERRSTLDLTVRDVPGLEVGDRHMSRGEMIDQPMDFSTKNRISLVDLQDMLVKVARPDIELGTPGFGLHPAHREHMLDAMREYPRESANPVYDPAKYPDDWVKFLLPGLDRVAPRGTFTIYNKVGLAYGFMIENAYVVHEPTGRSLFVTATVYANPNGTLNDNTYGYDDTSLPFFADLGEAIGRHLHGE